MYTRVPLACYFHFNASRHYSSYCDFCPRNEEVTIVETAVCIMQVLFFFF
ncbi:hypothetical protein PUN28_012496 [Cardiocondyla obscurior]|uniref:Uncharacterized protein n=1 Tax=Cardiocondyla obscurior TaxID=286306 RepID=A0AAW2FGS0_9HYME